MIYTRKPLSFDPTTLTGLSERLSGRRTQSRRSHGGSRPSEQRARAREEKIHVR